MMQRILVLSFSVALICFTASAYGAWIEDFESYSLGALTPQSDWENWNTSVEDPSQVVFALGDDNKYAVAVAGVADPSPDTDLVHPFTGYSSGKWTFTTEQYIPSSSTTGTHYFILMNSYPADLNWSVQLPFNLASGLLNDDYQAGDENVVIVRDKWIQLRFDIDLDANTVDSYYDGTKFSTHSWTTDGKHEIQALDLYPAGDDVSVVFYDNFSLIPEPATGLLLMVGSMVGLLVWRRR